MFGAVVKIIRQPLSVEVTNGLRMTTHKRCFCKSNSNQQIALPSKRHSPIHTNHKGKYRNRNDYKLNNSIKNELTKSKPLHHGILPLVHLWQAQYFSNENENRKNKSNMSNNENNENSKSPRRDGIEIDKLSSYPTMDIPIEDKPDWVLIGVEDCQNVFRLNDQDLKDIVLIRKYDPYDDTKERHWYYLRDAWEKSCEKYGHEVVQNWYLNFTSNVQDRVTFESLYGWKNKDRPKQPSSPLWNWLKTQISTQQSIKHEEESNKASNVIRLRPLSQYDGLRVVQRAAIANVTKTIIMFSFFLYTQSYTLYSESLHATADSINQFLLLSAVYGAARDPDWTHPYGYGARRWVVSSLSGGVLAGMGVMSIYAGLSEVWHPHVPEHLYAGVLTCLLSFCLELYSFIPAFLELRKNSKRQQLSILEYLRYGTDSSTIHVFCEDFAGALSSLSALGFLSAAVGYSPIWDCYGSVAIGSVLTGVGSFLCYRNIQLLSGQSVQENVLEEVLRVLNKNAMVASHHDLKSMVVGINSCVIKIEVNFNADKIADKHINIKKIFPNFQNTIHNENMTQFHDIMMQTCAEYQTWLTLERSLLESEIRKKVKEFGYKRVHVDIENY